MSNGPHIMCTPLSTSQAPGLYMYMHVYIGALGMKERRNSIVQDLKSIVKDIKDVSYISTNKCALNYICKNCVQTTSSVLLHVP